MSLFESASLVVTPNGTKASKLYAIKPTSGAGDLSVTRATTATRVNSAGLIESVASNVPRLDYTNSSCPSILVEPQRTNLLTYSEEFDNVAWTKTQLTVTANATISPSGVQNADKLIPSNVNSFHNLYNVATALTGSYVFNVFAKKGGYNFLNLQDQFGGIFNSCFDLNNGTFTTYAGSAFIKSFDNDWYLCTVIGSGSGVTVIPSIIPSNSTSSFPIFVGNGTDGIFVWGAQLEASSYPTSYIPTVATSVTRNADVISKTGISSLIGQTEGTMFCEIQNWQTQLDKVILALSDGSTSNYLQISSNSVTGDLQSVIFTGGTPGVLGTIVPVIGQNYKIAIGYKLNDYAIYINGTQVGTFNSKAAPSSLTRFDLGSIEFLASNYQPRTPYKVAAIWKNRISNAELIELTTL